MKNIILIIGVISLHIFSGCNPLGSGTDMPQRSPFGAQSQSTASTALANCLDEAFNPAECTTVTGRYVSSIAGADITAWTNAGGTPAISASIPTGFYSGKSVSFSDSNLVASKIVNGITIFGVTGTAGAEAHSSCTAANQSGCVATTTFKTQAVPATPAAATDVLSTKQFYTGGAIVTGTMVNRGTQNFTPNTTNQSITAGYYAGGTVSGDTDLIAANIKSGVDIFGVVGTGVLLTGTATSPATTSDIATGKQAWNSSGVLMTGSGAAGGTILLSDMYRDRLTTAMTQGTETGTYAGTGGQDLPAGYRDIPDTTKDDDGYYASGNTTSQVVAAARPSNDCGKTQGVLAERIAECASLNPTTSTWDGATKANAGQAVWKLVTRFGAGKEVWQDTRTGLLWSSIVKVGESWCKAAGNAQAGDAYCTDVAHQPDLSNVESWCAEVGPAAYYQPVTGSGETWTNGTYSVAKGGMGKKAAGGTNALSVRWRLPNVYDYQQANIDGIRFVMPDMVASAGDTVYEWTATVTGSNTVYAYVFGSGHGEIIKKNRADITSYSVRCVGR